MMKTAHKLRRFGFGLCALIIAVILPLISVGVFYFDGMYSSLFVLIYVFLILGVIVSSVGIVYDKSKIIAIALFGWFSIQWLYILDVIKL